MQEASSNHCRCGSWQGWEEQQTYLSMPKQAVRVLSTHRCLPVGLRDGAVVSEDREPADIAGRGLAWDLTQSSSSILAFGRHKG